VEEIVEEEVVLGAVGMQAVDPVVDSIWVISQVFELIII
jgi:hypothetical protein